METSVSAQPYVMTPVVAGILNLVYKIMSLIHKQFHALDHIFIGLLNYEGELRL